MAADLWDHHYGQLEVQVCCMIGGDREERLRREVIELREELRRLTLRVDRQGDQLSDLASATSSLASQSFVSNHLEEAEERFDDPSPVSGPPVGDTVSEVISSGYSLVTGPQEARSEEAPYSWVLREEVARGIGQFLLRALSGENRGNSGRQRLRLLQSRLYIVVRDAEGVVSTHPVRVLRSYAAVRQLCQRGGEFRNAVFIGIPSAREGRIAVGAAGFDWPAIY